MYTYLIEVWNKNNKSTIFGPLRTQMTLLHIHLPFPFRLCDNQGPRKTKYL